MNVSFWFSWNHKQSAKLPQQRKARRQDGLGVADNPGCTRKIGLFRGLWGKDVDLWSAGYSAVGSGQPHGGFQEAVAGHTPSQSSASGAFPTRPAAATGDGDKR